MFVQLRGYAVAVAILCFAPRVYCQFDQGQIAGTVKDSSDAFVAGAEVTAVDKLSGLRSSAVTGQNGSYTLTSLPVGYYEVTIQSSGFKKYIQSNVKVDAATRTTMDATLEVGQVTETVNVEAAVALVERETAQIGRTVEAQQITDLALNGRNPIKLAVLKAGVISAENFNDFAPAQLHEQFSINGGRRAGNNTVIDGVNANRTRGDFNGTAELGLMNTDAIQEVQILTSTYPAEFGHAMDGQIIFVSKSGGRDFHGSAYEFFRNAKLDANNWTRNQSPNQSDNSRPAPFRFNEPGYSIGGPIFIPRKFNSNRNKLFFFGSQEWVVYRQDKTSTGIVPTAAMRRGDFGELLSPANTFFRRTRVVTDPNTGAPFVNNVIPSNRLSPNGIGILNSYPLPTPGFLQGTSNWIETLAHPIDSRRDSIRIDYYVSDKNRINFSGTHFSYHEDDPFAPTGPLDRSDSRWDRPNMTASVGFASTISPTMVNQFIVSAAEDVVRIGIYDNGVGKNGEPWTREQYGINYPYFIPGQLRIQNRIPDAIISGFSQVDGSTRPTSSSGPIYGLSDSFTWIKNSSHTLKFGVALEEAQQNNQDQTGVQNGTFTFLDSGNPRTTGVAVANVALGNFDNDVQRGPAAYTLLRSLAVEAYAQDTWKATPNLTFELGVRYSYFQPWWAKWNDIANFEPQFYDLSKAAVIDPVAGFIVSGSQYNGVVLPGAGFPPSAAGRAYGALIPGTSALFHNLPSGFVDSYHKAFAPRLGIAYRIADKTVVRAGGGMFHHRQQQNQNALFGNAPNLLQVTVVNGLVDNPGGSAQNFPFDFKALALNAKYPTAYSYSLSIQRELPGQMVLDVSYVGKLAVNQERTNGINALAPGTVQRFPTQSQASLKPYRGLGNINWTTRDGRVEYNSLQVTLDKRFHSGLGLGVAYTFSKSLSNLMNQISPMLPYDPTHFVKGLDELDRTHVVNANFIYDLPFGRQGGKLTQNALGGWHLSGVYFARSGAPLSVTSAVDTAGVGVGLGPQTWNIVGDLAAMGSQGVGKPWFNPASFARPAAGTFGNAGLGIIRGPSFKNLDLAVFKDFKVSERFTAQFRVESFDLANHPFLANPGIDPTSPATFGIVTSKGGTSVAGSGSAASASQRNMQIALKLRF